jgi:Zn-finger nucleic acid-binding protein
VSYDVYKAAVMRVLPAAPEIPLEAPPAESFDLQDVIVCPACGGADAAVQEVEDAEIAKCPQCQCEFAPHMESVSRKVIRRISEHRQRRMQRFMERLPRSVPGIDRTDYDLFRKIVDKGEATVAEPEQEIPVEA